MIVATMVILGCNHFQVERSIHNRILVYLFSVGHFLLPNDKFEGDQVACPILGRDAKEVHCLLYRLEPTRF